MAVSVPSFFAPETDRHARRWGIARAELLLPAVEHHADRGARLLRQTTGDDGESASGGGGLKLAAEAAAHVFADHPNVLAVDAQSIGQSLPHGEDALRGGVDRELCPLPLGDHRVSLEGRVGVDGEGVGRFEGDLGVARNPSRCRRGPTVAPPPSGPMMLPFRGRSAVPGISASV